MKSTDVRVMVVVSDLHCGSVYGLLPPGVVSIHGNEIRQNVIQRALWDAWVEAWDDVMRIVGTDPWVLVVNGDAIEGNHHRTKEIITPDEADHLNAAIECIRPLAAQAAACFIVEGTECHTKDHEHVLAKHVGAVPDPNTGRAAWRRLQATVCGMPLVVHHHIGTTSRTWLESGEPGRAIANEQLEALRSNDVVAKILVASHRHRWHVSYGPGAMAVVTPAWQTQTRWARKVVPSARSAVGLMVLDWRTRRDGEFPIVHPIIRDIQTATWTPL